MLNFGTNNHISLPVKLKYSLEYITQKEFSILVLLSMSDKKGKSAWKEISELLGYKSVNPIKNALEDMEDRDLIQINNKYEIDVAKLLELCYTSNIKIEQPKEKDNRPLIVNKYLISKCVQESIPKNIKILKSIFSSGFSVDDCKTFIDSIMNSGYKYVDAAVIMKYVKDWDNKGKPSNYNPYDKTKKRGVITF